MKPYIYNEIYDYNLHQYNQHTFLFNIHNNNKTIIKYIICIYIYLIL